MKKIVLFIILIAMCLPVQTFAAEKYIALEEYPYSTHTLGEDLTVYGSTNINAYISLGLYTPYYDSYKILFNDSITPKELKNGYTIPIPNESNAHPEGKWLLVVQFGNVRDELYINMTAEPLYDRYVRMAEYSDNTLVSVETFKSRGIQFKDNIISFTTESSEEIRIFSWNNLSPVNEGDSRIFVAHYVDGYITKVNTYEGTLLYYNGSVCLESENGKYFKLLYWGENLIPVK